MQAISSLIWDGSPQHNCQGRVASPPLDMGSEAVEVNEILHYVLVLTHVQILKISFGFTFGVMQSEVFS